MSNFLKFRDADGLICINTHTTIIFRISYHLIKNVRTGEPLWHMECLTNSPENERWYFDFNTEEEGLAVIDEIIAAMGV